MKHSFNRQKRFVHVAGKTYFSKDTERRICFFLTLAMLIAAICYQAGVF